MKRLTLAMMITVFGSALAACSSNPTPRTGCQYTDDMYTTAAVNEALGKQSSLDPTKIHVETQKGLVQLSGFVKTIKQRQTAERVALSVKNVKGVQNGLITDKEAHSVHAYYEAEQAMKPE